MKQALPVRKHELEIGLKRPSPRIAVDGAEGGYEKLGLARDVTEYIEIVVNEFNERYQTNFENIASLMNYNRKAATGFLNYRLTPFLLRNENFLTELL